MRSIDLIKTWQGLCLKHALLPVFSREYTLTHINTHHSLERRLRECENATKVRDERIQYLESVIAELRNENSCTKEDEEGFTDSSDDISISSDSVISDGGGRKGRRGTARRG